MTDTELEQIEKMAFRRFYEDGLLDMLLGLLLVLMPLPGWLADRLSETATLVAYAALVFALVGLAMVLRARVVRPRVGSFRPGAERRRKIAWVRWALVGSVVLGVMFWLAGALRSGQPPAAAGIWVPLLFFINSVVVFGIMGWFLDVPRFIVYGPLFGSAILFRELPRALWEIDVPLAVAFGVPGLVIVGVGVYKLVHFLRDYPAHPRGAALDG